MSKTRFDKITWKDILLSCIYTPLIIFQFILFFFFYYNYYGLDYLTYIGWVLWALSIIFGILPILSFKRKGGVAKGESYMRTTKLVDTGIYSIVRHPQYLAGFLLIIALIFITQHWLSIVAGVLAFIAFYIDTYRVDPPLIKKFGDEYKEYMKRVPRLNFILGIIRKAKRQNH